MNENETKDKTQSTKNKEPNKYITKLKRAGSYLIPDYEFARKWGVMTACYMVGCVMINAICQGYRAEELQHK